MTLSREEIDRDLAFAIEAAASAGRRALGLRKTGRWEGRVMADVGDQACDGFLQGFVRGRYPADGLLSEETKDTPRRTEKERAWIVDPLDGTREFSEGRADWAVHVALTVGGRCALGAVALPSQGRTIFGVALAGHERFGVEGEGALIGGDSESADPPRVAVSRSHTPEWIEKFVAAVGGTKVAAGSVGHKVSLLLLGEADLYVHKVGLKEWDTCAPEVVARALGWTVSKLRGEEHAYNRPDPYNHELVVCRPSWHGRVVEALASSGALDD